MSENVWRETCGGRRVLLHILLFSVCPPVSPLPVPSCARSSSFPPHRHTTTPHSICLVVCLSLSSVSALSNTACLCHSVSLCLSVCLFVCMSLPHRRARRHSMSACRLSVCPSVCLCLSIYLSICPSVGLSHSLSLLCTFFQVSVTFRSLSPSGHCLLQASVCRSLLGPFFRPLCCLFCLSFGSDFSLIPPAPSFPFQ